MVVLVFNLDHNMISGISNKKKGGSYWDKMSELGAEDKIHPFPLGLS